VIVILAKAKHPPTPDVLAVLPAPQSGKHYQREAMSTIAMECFNSRDERLTYEQLTARIKDARRLSKARTADRIQGMIQTEMVVQHSDGTFSRSHNSE
jgi:hypothetical protein